MSMFLFPIIRLASPWRSSHGQPITSLTVGIHTTMPMTCRANCIGELRLTIKWLNTKNIRVNGKPCWAINEVFTFELHCKHRVVMVKWSASQPQDRGFESRLNQLADQNPCRVGFG